MKFGLPLRIILYLAIIFTVINGWWFMALPLLLFGVWRFEFRVEIILVGIVYDALFGMVRGMGLWGYAGTLTAIGILTMIAILKRVVR